MSIRHLDALFSPASVPVIGAAMRPASVGGTVWRNLNNGRIGIEHEQPRNAGHAGDAVHRDCGVLGPIPLA
ncbi:MAG: hypothetical protein Q8N51_06460 [Gammaproteobacteria bacterium]|nr:hypothetical protein [Gammaproteobacteria bacterium]